jgi:hypothetical protein
MRELLKNFEDTLCHSASASHCEDHGTINLRCTLLCNILSCVNKSLFHHVVVLIHVGASEEDERCLKFLLEHEFSDTTEKVKSSSYASIPSKSN